MVQKTLRGYLARKQHQPRYKGIAKINAIRRNMKQMEEIANQVKKERESMLNQIKEIDGQIDLAIKKIKVSFGHNDSNRFADEKLFCRQIRQ